MPIGHKRKRLQSLKVQRMRGSTPTDPDKHVETRHRNQLLTRGPEHHIAAIARRKKSESYIV